MTMYTSEQESLLTSAMSEIFQEQLNHIRTSLQSPDFNKEHDFIVKNAQFIVDIMMKKIETHYKSKGLAFPKDLEAISGEFRKVK